MVRRRHQPPGSGPASPANRAGSEQRPEQDGTTGPKHSMIRLICAEARVGIVQLPDQTQGPHHDFFQLRVDGFWTRSATSSGMYANFEAVSSKPDFPVVDAAANDRRDLPPRLGPAKSPCIHR
jgi:hypothetical protein